jgi:hypothetical protein
MGVGCLHDHQVKMGEKKSALVLTEDSPNEVGTFLSVPKKGGLEELRGCWPGQHIVSAKISWRKRNGVNRREGSFTRQRSTISLNAREYLCTPPSRSRVGGADSTLQDRSSRSNGENGLSQIRIDGKNTWR